MRKGTNCPLHCRGLTRHARFRLHFFAGLVALSLLSADILPAQQQQQQPSPLQQTLPAPQTSSPPQSQSPAPPPSQSKISTEVKFVTVYATVRDKHGKIIPNLNQADFTLTEDARPQTIKYFARESDLPLTLGLLVDTSMSQRRLIEEERTQRAIPSSTTSCVRRRTRPF